MIYAEAKWKASKFYNHSLWEIIYVHFYNWDRSLDFVPVMCVSWLNWSLKLHSGLWTIPHLILTHNTQDFVQLMLILFVWLYMFKCDVYAQLLVDQTQKYFWVFYMFLKLILHFHVFSFYQNACLCFSPKTGLEAVLLEARNLKLPTKAD